MNDFDYKKYSLENLEKWMSDALLSSEATPQEIYNVIRKVVEEEYYYFKHHTGRCYDLLALLNGNGNSIFESVKAQGEVWEKEDKILSCDKDDKSPECQKAWTDFWEDDPYPIHVSEDGDIWIPDSVTKEDKVVKWQLPVEVDGLTGECIVEFPDDLLEAANLKEGDTVEWIDIGGGSFELRKVNGSK